MFVDAPNFPGVLEPKLVGMYAYQAPYREDLNIVKHCSAGPNVYGTLTIIQKTLKQSI